RPLFTASALCLPPALLPPTSQTSFAQPKPAAPAAATADDNAPLEQIQLTDKQIQGLLSAQKDIAPVAASIPANGDEPSPKVQGQLDSIAKKNGFSGFAEYDQVSSNVNLVLAGFDP